MLLAKVVGVAEEGGTKGSGGGRAVRAGVGKKGVALPKEGVGKELA